MGFEPTTLRDLEKKKQKPLKREEKRKFVWYVILLRHLYIPLVIQWKCYYYTHVSRKILVTDHSYTDFDLELTWPCCAK